MSAFIPEPTGEHTVYVHRDARGRALYIGVSRDPWKRWLRHVEHSPWWAGVARIDFLGSFATRAEALAVEADAIRTFQPRWNKNGVSIMTRVARTVALDAESPFKLGNWLAFA